jgi:glucose-6-phosphate 1-dehydrogenase
MTDRCTKLTVPTQLVLLGATGDLAQKKLLAALMDLYAKDLLPERFHIVAFSKDEHTTESYRDWARAYVQPKGRTHDARLVTSFLDTIEYVQGMFDDQASFARIRGALERYDAAVGLCTSKLFYLAVPPIYYDTIFEQIARTGLDLPCAEGVGWVRILVEKPFGRDLDHAHQLEDKLSVLFKEEQIYRIDHYLAKDALQNILAFRFSNVLFEDQWNKEFVEAVYVRVFEQFDVSTRGSFFDHVGALRDVGQNHMLQMLALIAMDRPDALDTDTLRATRTAVFRTLQEPRAGDAAHDIVKGQYAGYRDTRGVAPDSRTETYFALKTYLDTERWKGVPWYLEHGKAMRESVSDITVRFRSAKNCICGTREPHDHPNFVRFSISPEQKIAIRFWVRDPGSKYELVPDDLVFDRGQAIKNGNGTIRDAYEGVLFDALCGDQTLFVSSAEQEATWKYVTRILLLWQSIEPLQYEVGTDGPASGMKDVVQRMFGF